MRVLALLVFGALTGCAAAGLVTLPPPDYRGDVEVTVRFVADVDRACREAGLQAPPPLIARFEACTTPEGELILPNPCRWPGFDAYARLTCHEAGHANGWAH